MTDQEAVRAVAVALWGSTTRDAMEMAEVAVQALADRLLPPGGITTIEYGLQDPKSTRRFFPVYIGTTEWARLHATHQRERTVWIGEGPNDLWARYVTEWEDIGQMITDQINADADEVARLRRAREQARERL